MCTENGIMNITSSSKIYKIIYHNDSYLLSFVKTDKI